MDDVRKGIDSDAFIGHIQEVLPRELNISRAGVYLYDAEAGGLLSSWLIGAPSSEKVPARVQPIGHSISGRCFAENITIHLPDCEKSDLIPRKYVESLRLGASLAVPIPGHCGAPIGVLRVDRERAEPFSEEDIDLFEALAAILGTIIMNTRVYHELKEAERRALHAASHDPLTLLANRRLFKERLTECLNRSRGTTAQQFVVMFLDLDGFKEINDTHGHGAGDAVLVEVGKRLRALLRQGDLVARLGGDEFGLILEPMKEAQEAGAVAQRIIDSLQEPIRAGGASVVVTTSIGVILAGGSYKSEDDVLHDADAAMYRAKKHKNRFALQEKPGIPAP